jgi:hypothetical protein
MLPFEVTNGLRKRLSVTFSEPQQELFDFFLVDAVHWICISTPKALLLCQDELKPNAVISPPNGPGMNGDGMLSALISAIGTG